MELVADYKRLGHDGGDKTCSLAFHYGGGGQEAEAAPPLVVVGWRLRAGGLGLYTHWARQEGHSPGRYEAREFASRRLNGPLGCRLVSVCLSSVVVALGTV